MAGWGLADEDGVDIFIVVADPGAGLAADGRAVIWLALAEIVNALHIGAGVAVEELFEERFAGDFGDADVFYLSCDLGGGFLRTEGEGKERERARAPRTGMFNSCTRTRGLGSFSRDSETL